MRTSRELFDSQRKRRFGLANPERMLVPHWEYMIRSRQDPYPVCKELGAEHNLPDCGPEGCTLRNDPDWCFLRFGMSQTRLADGRVICIAGEHEDWYDPDFCIYNDVIVLRPAAGADGVDLESGKVEIYGYPESVFPPTDFHSATLVGERIIIIGRLGYGGTRQAGVTPVLSLDTSTYAIEPLQTSGPCPGWIYSHHASYDAGRHAITVRGGNVFVPDATSNSTNLAAHRLHLGDRRWEVISERERHSRIILRADDTGDGVLHEAPPEAFRPASVPHLVLPTEDHGVQRYGLDVGGVRVTFEDFFSEVRVRVEGNLPAEVIDALSRDVIENLGQTTGAAWRAETVERWGDEQ